MTKRVIYFAMFFMFLTGGLLAQQEKPLRIHQVGINFSSLNSFGLHYKTGSEKTLLRLSLLSLNLGNNANWGRAEDSVDVKAQNYGAGFRIGFEKHVPIIKKFDFIWGLETGCSYFYERQKIEMPYNDRDHTSWNITSMVNLILGATYTISDHFVFGAEITPGIHYTYGKSKNVYPESSVEQTNSSFGFGFSNNFASLSLAYRFGK